MARPESTKKGQCGVVTLEETKQWSGQGLGRYSNELTAVEVELAERGHGDGDANCLKQGDSLCYAVAAANSLCQYHGVQRSNASSINISYMHGPTWYFHRPSSAQVSFFAAAFM